MMEERRRYPRYRRYLEVAYETGDTVGISCATNTFDISRGGLSMPVNKAIKLGKKINLRIKLPYYDKEVTAQGRVVWKGPVRRTLSQEEYAGIEFMAMDDGSRSALAQYLETISA